MTNPHFIGLVHSILSSAEAALGELNSPMTSRILKDGVMGRRTGERSLLLLEMLQEKTHGNLDETERDALIQAIRKLRDKLATMPDTPPSESLPN